MRGRGGGDVDKKLRSTVREAELDRFEGRYAHYRAEGSRIIVVND